MKISLSTRIWRDYLHEDLKELLNESILLIDRVEKWEEEFHDYAFVVFPAAKAYEGFLKGLFLDLGFITEQEFSGKRFRIGKALNPSLYKRDMKRFKHYRRLRERTSVYDKLISFCNGEALANELWQTWKICRNLLFHWFPGEKNAITFEEARDRVLRILDAMDSAYNECKIEKKEDSNNH